MGKFGRSCFECQKKEAGGQNQSLEEEYKYYFYQVMKNAVTYHFRTDVGLYRANILQISEVFRHSENRWFVHFYHFFQYEGSK